MTTDKLAMGAYHNLMVGETTDDTGSLEYLWYALALLVSPIISVFGFAAFLVFLVSVNVSIMVIIYFFD